jgi:hypothetical protein
MLLDPDLHSQYRVRIPDSQKSMRIRIHNTMNRLLRVPGQPSRVDDLEDPRLLVLPLDVAGVPLGPVVQQLLQEVPQQATVRRR